MKAISRKDFLRGSAAGTMSFALAGIFGPLSQRAFAEEEADAALDLEAALESGVYAIKKAEQDYLTVDCYEIEGVRYCTNVVSE
ncbi:MAG: hypothetical protein LUF30_13335, partial [Lachnospiraceae bacterium]|nr:hypothetical protein [Lachnospiraceae bacterium]